MSGKKPSGEELRHLEDALIESILSTDPAELRAEMVQAGEDPAAAIAATKKTIENAISAAGRQRLENAKAQVIAFQARPKPTPNVQKASFDMPTTLAARKGGDLSKSDEEALQRALAMLKMMEDQD